MSVSITKLVGNKAKERMSKRVSRKQSMPNFPKNEHFLYPDTHTYACVLGGKKCSFFGVFGMLCWIELNNSILRWYCTIAEANKNQPLITINMVNNYHVEADTKVISIRQPYTAMIIPHWYQNRFMHPQGE